MHVHSHGSLNTNAQLELWLTKPTTRAEITGYQESEDAWCVPAKEAWKWGVKDGADVERLAKEAPTLAERLAGVSEPTAIEIAARGVEAFARWIKAGLPVVDAETLQARRDTCSACPLWQPEARAGLGRCNHKSCCCTKLKLERCNRGLIPLIRSSQNEYD